jgi:Ca-activated chloride channel homolog
MLEDGTAIGTAIATAANRLRQAPGESRVMMLMTDGENNRGEIDPITAAQAAARVRHPIYTIGVGSEGRRADPGRHRAVRRAVRQPAGHIDEDLLARSRRSRGGRYFRATNEAALDSIYAEIDRLERTTVEVPALRELHAAHLPFLLLAPDRAGRRMAVRASRWGRVP